VTTRASQNIVQSLLSAGSETAPAIFYRDQTVTYAQLRQRVLALTAALRERGLRNGQKVVLVGENTPLYVVCYLAVMHAGLTVVPIPPGISDTALAAVVKQMEVPLALLTGKAVKRLLPVLTEAGCQSWLDRPEGGQGAPSSVLIDEASASADPSTGQVAAVQANTDLAQILLTSGSTGIPKGVMISHRNIACNTADIVSYMNLGPADRAMVVMPFSYCFALSVLHSHLSVGGSVVLNNHFMFAEKMLDEMLAQQCTGLAGVPATFQILLRKTRFAQRRFPALRWLAQAGGRLPDPYIRELRAAFPQVELFIMYGQTEATARLSYLPLERLKDKLGSIGRGLPSTQLSVLRSDGTAVTPGSDEIGEIVAQGDNVALGYYAAPDESAQYFRQGRLFTGDLARVDADGFIFVVARQRNFIKAMGHRVSSQEIENVIAELEQVVQVAVCGAPHSLHGETMAAFVVPTSADALAAEQVTAHCQRRLANFKVPEHISLVPSLPRTHSGKLDRAALRELAEALAVSNGQAKGDER